MFTGVPALHKYSDVEFAMFNAYPVPSLLQWLKQHGYSTAAFVAAGNDYYNMVNAYKSLGFDTTVFLKELPKYKELLRIMDSDLYNFGLNFIRNNIRKPFLAYFVTMYAHWPWHENPPAGEKEISVKPNIPEIEFLANATLWRTRDLYNLISNILTEDSSAIIVFYGDHTPPQINRESVTYRKPPDAVPLLIINKGRAVKINSEKYAIPFYVINRIIYKLLVMQPRVEIYADILYPDSNLSSRIYEDIIKYGFSGF